MLTSGWTRRRNAVASPRAERHEEVFAAVGRHPNEATGFDDDAGGRNPALGAHEKVRAIGETGLDFYRETAPPRRSSGAPSRRRSRSPRELGLPIVIHARDPEGETSADRRDLRHPRRRAGGAPVILHCFSAPQRVADAAERGWYCSFAGNVTYPSAKELRLAAAKVPEDCSWSRPTRPTWRRSRCAASATSPPTSSRPREAVAEVRGVSYEELERTVEANARALFGW